MCLYTRLNCPHGQHACETCGKSGHGSGDCRTRVQPEELQHDSVIAAPDVSQGSSSGGSIPVAGFGRKGTGKDGNYGVAISAPSVMDDALLPAPVVPSGSSSSQNVDLASSPQMWPNPIPATTDDIEEWMRCNFRPLTNICCSFPPQVGDSILWRGVKMGPKGNPSTKVEHFNAKVRHTVHDEDGEWWVYVE